MADSYYVFCGRSGKPYVLSRPSPKRKYAWVEIDLIDGPYKLTPEGAQQVRDILRAANIDFEDLFTPSGERPVTFAGAGRIPNADAPQVTRALVEVASNPANQQSVRFP